MCFVDLEKAFDSPEEGSEVGNEEERCTRGNGESCSDPNNPNGMNERLIPNPLIPMG